MQDQSNDKTVEPTCIVYAPDGRWLLADDIIKMFLCHAESDWTWEDIGENDGH